MDEGSQVQISEEIKSIAEQDSKIMNADNVETTAHILNQLTEQETLKNEVNMCNIM